MSGKKTRRKKNLYFVHLKGSNEQSTYFHKRLKQKRKKNSESLFKRLTEIYKKQCVEGCDPETSNCEVNHSDSNHDVRSDNHEIAEAEQNRDPFVKGLSSSSGLSNYNELEEIENLCKPEVKVSLTRNSPIDKILENTGNNKCINQKDEDKICEKFSLGVNNCDVWQSSCSSNSVEIQKTSKTLDKESNLSISVDDDLSSKNKRKMIQIRSKGCCTNVCSEFEEDNSNSSTDGDVSICTMNKDKGMVKKISLEGLESYDGNSSEKHGKKVNLQFRNYPNAAEKSLKCLKGVKKNGDPGSVFIDMNKEGSFYSERKKCVNENESQLMNLETNPKPFKSKFRSINKAVSGIIVADVSDKKNISNVKRWKEKVPTKKVKGAANKVTLDKSRTKLNVWSNQKLTKVVGSEQIIVSKKIDIENNFGQDNLDTSSDEEISLSLQKKIWSDKQKETQILNFQNQEFESIGNIKSQLTKEINWTNINLETKQNINESDSVLFHNQKKITSILEDDGESVQEDNKFAGDKKRKSGHLFRKRKDCANMKAPSDSLAQYMKLEKFKEMQSLDLESKNENKISNEADTRINLKWKNERERKKCTDLQKKNRILSKMHGMVSKIDVRNENLSNILNMEISIDQTSKSQNSYKEANNINEIRPENLIIATNEVSSSEQTTATVKIINNVKKPINKTSITEGKLLSTSIQNDRFLRKKRCHEDEISVPVLKKLKKVRNKSIQHDQFDTGLRKEAIIELPKQSEYEEQILINKTTDDSWQFAKITNKERRYCTVSLEKLDRNLDGTELEGNFKKAALGQTRKKEEKLFKEKVIRSNGRKLLNDGISSENENSDQIENKNNTTINVLSEENGRDGNLNESVPSTSYPRNFHNQESLQSREINTISGDKFIDQDLNEKPVEINVKRKNKFKKHKCKAFNGQIKKVHKCKHKKKKKKKKKKKLESGTDSSQRKDERKKKKKIKKWERNKEAEYYTDMSLEIKRTEMQMSMDYVVIDKVRKIRFSDGKNYNIELKFGVTGASLIEILFRDCEKEIRILLDKNEAFLVHFLKRYKMQVLNNLRHQNANLFLNSKCQVEIGQNNEIIFLTEQIFKDLISLHSGRYVKQWENVIKLAEIHYKKLKKEQQMNSWKLNNNGNFVVNKLNSHKNKRQMVKCKIKGGVLRNHLKSSDNLQIMPRKISEEIENKSLSVVSGYQEMVYADPGNGPTTEEVFRVNGTIENEKVQSQMFTNEVCDIINKWDPNVHSENEMSVKVPFHFEESGQFKRQFSLSPLATMNNNLEIVNILENNQIASDNVMQTYIGKELDLEIHKGNSFNKCTASESKQPSFLFRENINESVIPVTQMHCIGIENIIEAHKDVAYIDHDEKNLQVHKEIEAKDEEILIVQKCIPEEVTEVVIEETICIKDKSCVSETNNEITNIKELDNCLLGENEEIPSINILEKIYFENFRTLETVIHKEIANCEMNDQEETQNNEEVENCIIAAEAHEETSISKIKDIEESPKEIPNSEIEETMSSKHLVYPKLEGHGDKSVTGIDILEKLNEFYNKPDEQVNVPANCIGIMELSNVRYNEPVQDVDMAETSTKVVELSKVGCNKSDEQGNMPDTCIEKIQKQSNVGCNKLERQENMLETDNKTLEQTSEKNNKPGGHGNMSAIGNEILEISNLEYNKAEGHGNISAKHSNNIENIENYEIYSEKEKKNEVLEKSINFQDSRYVTELCKESANVNGSGEEQSSNLKNRTKTCNGDLSIAKPQVSYEMNVIRVQENIHDKNFVGTDRDWISTSLIKNNSVILNDTSKIKKRGKRKDENSSKRVMNKENDNKKNVKGKKRKSINTSIRKRKKSTKEKKPFKCHRKEIQQYKFTPRMYKLLYVLYFTKKYCLKFVNKQFALISLCKILNYHCFCEDSFTHYLLALYLNENDHFFNFIKSCLQNNFREDILHFLVYLKKQFKVLQIKSSFRAVYHSVYNCLKRLFSVKDDDDEEEEEEEGEEKRGWCSMLDDENVSGRELPILSQILGFAFKISLEDEESYEFQKNTVSSLSGMSIFEMFTRNRLNLNLLQKIDTDKYPEIINYATPVNFQRSKADAYYKVNNELNGTSNKESSEKSVDKKCLQLSSIVGNKEGVQRNASQTSVDSFDEEMKNYNELTDTSDDELNSFSSDDDDDIEDDSNCNLDMYSNEALNTLKMYLKFYVVMRTGDQNKRVDNIVQSETSVHLENENQETIIQAASSSNQNQSNEFSEGNRQEEGSTAKKRDTFSNSECSEQFSKELQTRDSIFMQEFRETTNRQNTAEVTNYSPYNLIQEKYCNNPWQLIVASMLLEVSGKSDPENMIHKFLDEWPSAFSVLKEKDENKFTSVLKSVHNVKCTMDSIKKFCKFYISEPNINLLNYKELSKYCVDSYYIFCKENGCSYVRPNDVMLNMYVHWKTLII